jgi:putative FmdB family regulatory protein
VPTYEYQCDRCQTVFEVRQRISEPPLTTHDGCGGAVRRLLSPAPFILKGEGWYVTDYPSAARKKGQEAEKSAATTTPSTDKADKSGKTDKPGKADKPAAAPKSEGGGAGGTSAASSGAATSSD